MAKLDNICEAAECTNIIIDDLLKFIPYDQISIVIQHLITRLRHHGKITLIFTSFDSIMKKFSIGKIDEQTCNHLLFEGGARSCFSYQYIENMLKELKVNILIINIDERVIINAERPYLKTKR